MHRLGRLAHEVSISAFVIVMGLAALSILAHYRDYPALSEALLWAAVAALGAVAALLALRAAVAPRGLLEELSGRRTAYGLFTLGAAAALVADRLALHDWRLAALVVWCVAAAVWAAHLYALGFLLVVSGGSRLEESVAANWALPIVATQTLVSTATFLSARWASDFFLFVGLTGFLIAFALYLVLVGWFAQRLVFGDVRPEEASKGYWIVMSALASSGLASTRLIDVAQRYELVESVRSVLEAFAVTAWAGSAAWIPFLLLLGAWNVRRRGRAEIVNPDWADVVFPLAMFGAASWEVAKVIGITPFFTVAEAFLWAGLATLAVTVAALAVWIRDVLSGA